MQTTRKPEMNSNVVGRFIMGFEMVCKIYYCFIIVQINNMRKIETMIGAVVTHVFICLWFGKSLLFFCHLQTGYTTLCNFSFFHCCLLSLYCFYNLYTIYWSLSKRTAMTKLLEGYYKAIDHFYKFVKVCSCQYCAQLAYSVTRLLTD